MRRVVITGLGAATPLGKSVDELWNNLLNGETSISDVTDICPWLSDYDVKIGSLFKDYKFNAGKCGIEKKAPSRMSPFSQYALDAACQAVEDSGILDYRPDETRERTGVLMGVGFCGLKEVEKQKERMQRFSMSKVSPFVVPMTIQDAASGNIAKHLHLHGTEGAVVSSACSSGASSIIEGYKDIMMGDVEIMLCGGTEESAASLTYSGFGNAKALSRRNGDPAAVSRPFDKDRSGFVIGEGSGVLVLEELEHAKKRGAKIRAELIGYGRTCDGNPDGMTAPRLDGVYASKAMTDALKRANINSDQVDYINTHGTSTQLNDPTETLAIKKALGEGAYNVSLNSTKSMIGHTLGAAGGLEAVVTVKTIEDGAVHPTKNLENPDINPYLDPRDEEKLTPGEIEMRKCDLDYSMRNARDKDVRVALSNSFGFYGHNTVLAFKKFEG